jgi:hypothetical protein
MAAVAIAGVVIFLVPRLGSRAPDAPSAFPFPCLGAEGEAQHIHPYLRILIQGQPLTIPAFVGIRELPEGSVCFEPVHTHDASGIIHIESTSPTQAYTLGDFFAIWRATYQTVEIHGRDYPVDYTVNELLGHKADAAHAIRLLVDGKPSSEGPALVLNRLDYCSAAMTDPPCYPTAVTDPYPLSVKRRDGTGHTIVLEYIATSASP